MTPVTVVVPWRGGCEWREQAWAYVRSWWSVHHPTWQVIASPPGPDGGPWCKAAAVAAALPRADGEVLVVADADVLTSGVTAAVEAVTVREAPWAVPHYAVHRMTAEATYRLYTTGQFPALHGPRAALRNDIGETHRGVQGGGMVVLPRSAWELCPLDARFTGWGQEDLAWGWALTRTVGGPWRGRDPLLHLWHPPQDRLSRGAGSPAGVALWERYRRAYTAAEVRALLDEPGARP